MPIDRPLCDVLRSLRAKAGLTQAQLAERCNVTQNAISDLERTNYIKLRLYSAVFSELGYELQLMERER